MTSEEFRKKRWKWYEIIDYHEERQTRVVVIPCILLGVDFQNELFRLEPLDMKEYSDDSFWVHINWCKRPPYKLRKAK